MTSAELRRRALACGIALAANGSGAVPPPLPQTGADCARPTYASDRLVCGDTHLLALDRRVSAAWRAIATVPPAADLPPLLEAQQAWFARRSRCAFVEAHAACLQAAYDDRARVLDAWQRAVSGGFTGPGERLRCTGAPWGESTVTAHRPAAGTLVLSRSDAGLSAIATADAGQEGWRPYLQLGSAALPLRLWPLSGAVIDCSAA